MVNTHPLCDLLDDLVRHRNRLDSDARTVRIGIVDLVTNLVASPEDIAEQALKLVAAAARVSVANTAINLVRDHTATEVLEHVTLTYSSARPPANLVEQRRRDGYRAELEALALYLDR